MLASLASDFLSYLLRRFIPPALFILALSADLELMAQDEFARGRNSMVALIEARGVSDEKLLRVMRELPRHEFVPEEYREEAYSDFPLPIGHGQTISQPYIVAFMTEILAVKPHHKVLEVGTGSGYQAAVLAKLAGDVYSIEIVKPLAESSAALLKKLGTTNVRVRAGDGYLGWPEAAPFDRIIVTAAPPEVPKKLVEQLKDGGRMIVPVGTYEQELLLITKEKGQIKEESKIPVRFVPMVRATKPAPLTSE